MPTRRTSRRASRSLRSNARPIPVDDALVVQLMKQVKSDLSKFKRRAASEIKTRRDLFERAGYAFGKRQVVEITDAKGGKIKVSISLRLPNRASPGVLGRITRKATLLEWIENVRSGKKYQSIADDLLMEYTVRLIPFEQDGSDAAIDLYVHPLIDEDPELLRWSNIFDTPLTDQEPVIFNWSMIDRAKSVATITETLRHELLHARDPQLYGKPLKGQPFPSLETSSEEQKRRWSAESRYYNQPSELRAHLAAVYGEIAPVLRKRIAQTKRSRAGTVTQDYVMSLFMAALQSSKEWNIMEPYLGEKSRKLILKGLVTALEDEGIIKIE
jgi:hypothetical protein